MDRYSAEREFALLNMSDLIYTVGERNLARIKSFYSEEDRYYHNWSHALDVLMAVLQLGLPDVPRRAHALAALFHDAVYVVGDKNNEANSVEMMLCMVPDKEKESVVLASDLIMATSKHMTSSVDNISPSHRNFLDCDILSLGSQCWPLVIQYDFAVCAERLHAGMSPDVALAEREKFLKTILAKPTIFLGSHYGPTNEWYARLNVRRLLEHRHDFGPLLDRLARRRR